MEILSTPEPKNTPINNSISQVSKLDGEILELKKKLAVKEQKVTNQANELKQNEETISNLNQKIELGKSFTAIKKEFGNKNYKRILTIY
jgi:peptidoglycan hydrolase CwlO-like protein